MEKIEIDGVPAECYERRCVELARHLGADVVAFVDLSTQYKEFFAYIGYTRVCALLVVNDLNRGRSERELARRYSLSRDAIRYIKENSARKGRIKWGIERPTTNP